MSVYKELEKELNEIKILIKLRYSDCETSDIERFYIRFKIKQGKYMKEQFAIGRVYSDRIIRISLNNETLGFVLSYDSEDHWHLYTTDNKIRYYFLCRKLLRLIKKSSSFGIDIIRKEGKYHGVRSMEEDDGK